MSLISIENALDAVKYPNMSTLKQDVLIAGYKILEQTSRQDTCPGISARNARVKYSCKKINGVPSVVGCRSFKKRCLKKMKDFEATIIDEERKKDFIKVFGTNVVKIKSPFPKRIILPSGKEALAYFLDLDLISSEEREKLIDHLSKRFNQEKDFVENNLNAIGVPILSDHCIIVVHNPQGWID